MHFFARGFAPSFDLKKFAGVLLGSALGAALAGCTTSNYASRGFSPAEYGVPASERVVAMGQPVPKGGGVYRVGSPYQVRGIWYFPEDKPGYTSTGIASWYGDDFHGRKTANGEIYNMYALSAAHPTLPLPSYARVTSLTSGRSVVVRINDRGPYHSGRVIDLSKRAALLLDMHGAGLGKVRVNYIGKAPLNGNDDSWLVAQARDNGRPMGRQMVAALAPVPGWAQADAVAPPIDVRTALADVLPPEDRPQSPSYRVASLQDVAPPAVADDERIGVEALRDSNDTPTQTIQAAASAPLALLPGRSSSPAVQAVTVAAGGRQAVQVGTFQDPSQAVRYRDALQKFGPATIFMNKIDGVTLYQVKLGPFDNPAQAEIALREAQQQGATGAQLVRM
jgi:rare lipoprotein A